MIRFACPQCKQVLQASDSAAGNVLVCGKCQCKLRVPAAPAVAAPPAPTPAPPVAASPPPAQVPVIEPVADVPIIEPVDDLPVIQPVPDGASEQARLGDFVMEAPAQLGLFRLIGAGLLLLPTLLFLFVFVAGLASGSGRSSRADTGNKRITSLLGGLMCPLITLTPAVFLFRSGLRSTKRRLMLYSGGVVECLGSKSSTYLFDEIKFTKPFFWIIRSRYGYPIYTFNRLTLHMVDGRKVVIDEGLENIEQLLKSVKMYSMRVRLQQALNYIQSGGTYPFGTYRLSQQGVEAGGQLYPWTQVKKAHQQYEHSVGIELVGGGPRPADTHAPDAELFAVVVDSLSTHQQEVRARDEEIANSDNPWRFD